MKKKNIYFIEVNAVYSGIQKKIKLPYSTGLIKTWCLQNKTIVDNYDFPDWICHRDDVDEVFDRIVDPSVVGFSCFTWNWKFNKLLAKRIKDKYPNCLIVFGGKEPPNAAWLQQNTEWIKSYPYLDIIVHAEGEVSFEEILIEHLNENPDYTHIEGCTINHGDYHTITSPRSRIVDLTESPSPYLNGMFDDIYEKYKKEGFIFSAVIESARGCPYSCTFCEIGDSYFTKIKQQPIQQIFDEIEWIGSHGIDFIDDATSNFGIFHDRDTEIAEWLVHCNEKYGNPQTFKVDWAKSKAMRLFSIAKILHDGGLHRGMTLAMQSFDGEVLKAVRRKNLVDDSGMQQITKMYEDAGISTYIEIILGLPDETLEGFKHGLCRTLEIGEHNHVGMYVLVALRNTPFGDKEYIKNYELKYKRILAPIARWVEPPDGIMETADLVIGHKTLPTEEWIEMYLFSWLIASCHHMGFTEKVVRFVREHYKIEYEEFYKKLFDYIGTHPNTILGKEYLSIKNHILQIINEDEPTTFWGRQSIEFPTFQGEKEEVSCLMYIKYKDDFYGEFGEFVKKNFDVNEDIINALVDFQKITMIDPLTYYPIKTNVEYNFVDVIHHNKKLKRGNYKVELDANNYGGDYLEYGTDLYYRRKTGAGRTKIRSKNGKILL
jgi:putative methyltransferase